MITVHGECSRCGRRLNLRASEDCPKDDLATLARCVVCQPCVKKRRTPGVQWLFKLQDLMETEPMEQPAVQRGCLMD